MRGGERNWSDEERRAAQRLRGRRSSVLPATLILLAVSAAAAGGAWWLAGRGSGASPSPPAPSPRVAAAPPQPAPAVAPPSAPAVARTEAPAVPPAPPSPVVGPRPDAPPPPSAAVRPADPPLSVAGGTPGPARAATVVERAPPAEVVEAPRGPAGDGAAPGRESGPATTGALPPDEAARLTARAAVLVGQGDISGARLLLDRAARSDYGPAAFALAETYDPAALAAWRVRGIRADPDRARLLYGQALVAGVADARERLERLP